MGRFRLSGLFPADTLVSGPAILEQGTKIAFLCGCAEAGKDGVGDYTRLLAEECARRGRGTLRVALNDGYADGEERAEGLVRLAEEMDWGKRVERAREAVDAFQADIVSLQWVTYGFHPKGTPWGIENGLKRVAGGRPVQMMCHEIWIGAEMGAGLKRRLIGAAQRAIMRRVLRELKPGVVQTSNPVYARLLENAEVLPLFGSIPVTGRVPPARGDAVRFGMFGVVHPEWRAQPLMERLLGLGKRIEIEHIGRIGNGGRIWEDMERRYRAEAGFKRHGEQPAEIVSQFLMEMDFGIATTPLALIGKSGTATAMIEHGLPVIVNRDDVRFGGPVPKPEGVITMDEEFTGALRGASRREPHWRLAGVADQFLESLRRTRAGAL